MENFSYNSYPDSGNSSPRSREIDFENTAPWEDQNTQNMKFKFMCSYGGKIHPRPHDNQLAYIGGETKILAVDCTIKFASMINKLSALCGEADVSFKYQLPGEDLDALISVTNDDDLEHMMHEYERLFKASAKPARMRLFLFPAVTNSSFGSDGSKSERDRFVEALNSGPSHVSESKKIPNNVDFLFGLEKEAVQPPPPPPPPEYHVPDDRGIGPDRVVYTDHAVNPVEIQRQLQRLQMREHEQQVQEAMFMRKTEENLAGGIYVAMPEKAQPPQGTVPLSVQQTAAFQVPGPSYPATVTSTHGQPEQPVYMIPQGTTVYHAPQPQSQPQPQPPPQMIRQVPGQPGQHYYPNMQRMAPGPPAHDVYREQPVYNMVLPPQTQAPPPNLPQMGMVRPSAVGGSGSGGGVAVTDTGYTQVAYDSGVGRQVYYTAAGGMVVQPPTTYQGGVGVAASGEMRGPEGKVVGKVSQN
ncbi:hypothetical protein Pint_33514 [Pistacia integerrima]|uniref:Uncharacterized protein n=1 Tax=Pistacia integerrima TaxID=434235 RepID=A0ACC0X682_9ROSI|nr:hypothetical protein Pint_33514 [Pistacia integerrima]